MATSTAPTHPEELTRADRRYIVEWGRRQATVSALAGVGFALSSVGLIRLSPFWLLGDIVVLPLAAVLVLFFRNPRRRVPGGPGLIVSPADGTVTDVAEVEEKEFVKGPAVRIGIFLSIFNVHVNRAPASGRVEWVCHREGVHHDARNPSSALENESNLIGIVREDSGGPEGLRILVKQISGAIARRIVCPLASGATVARGGLVGMIKYGSRTELYLPLGSQARVLVEPGDKVKGGLTVLAVLPAG